MIDWLIDWLTLSIFSERKLAKVQGKSGASTASALRRDLINGLASVRTDHMKNFMETEPVGPSSLTTIYSTDSSSNEPHFSTDSSDPLAASWLMQRVFPERQALSTEELAALIRNDALAAAVNDLSQPDNPSTHSIPAPPGCEDAASQSITTTRTTMGDHFAPAATTQHDPISSPAEESGDDGRLSDSI